MGYRSNESFKKIPLPPSDNIRGNDFYVGVQNGSKLQIPIEQPGMNFIEFSIKITDTKSGKEKFALLYPVYVTYNSISQDDYNKQHSEKIALFIGLISLSLTISFTAIRHLMELWDRQDR